MTFKNALLYDKRNFFKILFYYLIKKIEILNIIFNRSPFESLFLLLSAYFLSLLIDFTLNSVLFNDEFMEKKYKNNNKLDFLNSLFLSIESNLINFSLIWIINKLINYSYVLEMINKEFSHSIHYFKLLEIIFRKIKKRIIIYIILNFIISFFCCYYITIFCIIYNQSKISLFINYLLGNISSLVYTIILVFIISLLRKISMTIYMKRLYHVSIYFDENF